MISRGDWFILWLILSGWLLLSGSHEADKLKKEEDCFQRCVRMNQTPLYQLHKSPLGHPYCECIQRKDI